MRTRAARIVVALVLTTTSAASLMAFAPDASAISQSVDTDVPGNPVVGDARPGDIASASTTNYAAWTLIAVCLILAGLLLVKIERWEARRIPEPNGKSG